MRFSFTIFNENNSEISCTEYLEVLPLNININNTQKIMKTITLQYHQAQLLQKLAKKSKMDCWFDMDDNGVVRDLQNGGRVMSTKNACRQLIDGFTPEDLDGLSGREVNTLLEIAIKL